MIPFPGTRAPTPAAFSLNAPPPELPLALPLVLGGDIGKGVLDCDGGAMMSGVFLPLWTALFAAPVPIPSKGISVPPILRGGGFHPYLVPLR